MRHIITVDQAAIQRGDPDPIHVHDTKDDERMNVRTVDILGPSTVTCGPQRQDGARVWIETDSMILVQ